MKHLVALIVAPLVALLGGCNLIIGSEDHGAFPDNCGAESLTTAQASFSDDRNGHCYSRVRSEDSEMGTDFSTAKDSCTDAGGALACVNDAAELELMARNVTSRAWLGMNALHASALQSFSCVTGETFNPSFEAWGSGYPDSESGACTILVDGRVENAWCGGGIQFWICELAPNSEE